MMKRVRVSSPASSCSWRRDLAASVVTRAISSAASPVKTAAMAPVTPSPNQNRVAIHQCFDFSLRKRPRIMGIHAVRSNPIGK